MKYTTFILLLVILEQVIALPKKNEPKANIRDKKAKMTLKLKSNFKNLFSLKDGDFDLDDDSVTGNTLTECKSKLVSKWQNKFKSAFKSNKQPQMDDFELINGPGQALQAPAEPTLVGTVQEKPPVTNGNLGTATPGNSRTTVSGPVVGSSSGSTSTSGFTNGFGQFTDSGPTVNVGSTGSNSGKGSNSGSRTNSGSGSHGGSSSIPVTDPVCFCPCVVPLNFDFLSGFLSDNITPCMIPAGQISCLPNPNC